VHNLAGWLCFGLVFVFGLWFGVCLFVVVVVGAFLMLAVAACGSVVGGRKPLSEMMSMLGD
jgi:hypothetical protein